MMAGNSGRDGPRFQVRGAWATIAPGLMLREEFEQRGTTMETFQHVFFTQGTSSTCTTGTPLMLDNRGEVRVVVDLPDTLEIVVLSLNDESIEGLEDHLEDKDNLEDEDDPKEDQEIEKVGKE